ncbi:MAG: AAA family ATPase, partial [Candidatus Thermoplasmatota archaeon]|nr:AAA family ATPase [Candidatus Thermoplasmatota archaeon]
MNEEDLFDQNPWWRGRENIFHDPKVKKFDGASIKWEPRMKRCFHLEEGLVYTLRGPRQVGKTTLLKNLIRYELIKKRADPYSIFYFSSDLIDKKEELLELIALYEKIADRFGVKGRRKILIDEITNVRDWEKAIKYLRDTGKGKDHTFILTGSHSIDIKKSVERLPGRRGEGSGHILNKILVPMKFSEYIGTVDKELAKDLSEILSLHSEDRIRMIKDLSNGKMDGSIERLNSVYSRELDKWLDSYLLSGGIPVPIEHLVSGGSIPNDVYGIYVRSLMGDLARWGMKERIAKQIIRSVIEKMTTKVSLNAIAKE